VVSWISSPIATWTTLIGLLSVHLATNYAAVKSVSMRCLNRQRANIVLSHALQSGRVLSPTEVSKKERVFEQDGVLRWADDNIVGHCKIGVTMGTLLSLAGLRHGQTGSLEMHATKLSDLMRLFEDEAYILWKAHSDAVIVLKQGCTPVDQLKAWTQALLLAQREGSDMPDCKRRDDTSGDRLAELRTTLERTKQLFHTCEAGLRNVGWDLDIAALETRAGSRVEIGTKEDM
jgi:hypothetical protein